MGQAQSQPQPGPQGIQGLQGNIGLTGKTGDTGVGISSITYDQVAKSLIVSKTDGSQQVIPNVTTGIQGVGIKNASVDSLGNLTLLLSDGTQQGPFMVMGMTGKMGPVGPSGNTGSQGVGIQSSNVDTTGKLTLTMTDNTKQGPFNVMGPVGDTGVGISNITWDSVAKTLTITKSDNSTTVLKNITTGTQGIQGIGIASAAVDTTGNLTLTMTDSTKLGPFNVMGPQGIQGIKGDTGASGANFSGNLQKNSITNLGDSGFGNYQIKNYAGNCLDQGQMPGGAWFPCSAPGTNGPQHWNYNPMTGRLYSPNADRCLTNNGGALQLLSCDNNNSGQGWFRNDTNAICSWNSCLDTSVPTGLAGSNKSPNQVMRFTPE